MKKIIILILIISLFTLNIKANAAASINASSTNVYVGDTFTVNVNMSSAAAWSLHTAATGPVSGCIINQADASSDANDISKTFSVSCTATGVGTIVVTLSGDTTSASDGNAVGVSGSVTINVKERPVVQSKPQAPATPKSTDASLKNIELSSGNIEFSNDKDTYDLTVDYSVSSIEIKGISNDGKASVKIEGDTNLKEGDNVIKLIVTAEDGTTTKTYTLNIKRENKVLSKNSKIKKLTIDNYDISFNNNKKEYDLTISNEDSLTFNVELEDEFAKYEIVGNKKLKNKSVIKVIVTAEDNSSTVYLFNIIKEKNKTKELSTLLICSLVLNAIIIGLLIFIVIRLNKKDKKMLKELFKFKK